MAILVKTPGHSPVKSRLATARGQTYAIDWYLHAAAAVASVALVAQQRYGVTAYWAVAEPGATGAWPGLPTIAQTEGELGTRMAQVHAQLVASHGFGVLVGADAPQLTAALLGEAIDWLRVPSRRGVLGPADDGGFWLFGANTVPALTTWNSVCYSTSATARDLRESMRCIGDWRTLATLVDVDVAGDLAPVQHALQLLPDPTPEQRSLARWMRAHEATAL